MLLFDLQDVCVAIGSLATLDLPMVVDLFGIYVLKGPYSIGSLATLDLPMVVDLFGIYVLKGPYCTLTTTNWFLQALSVIPRGSWGDVARRFTMIRWGFMSQLTHNPSSKHRAPPPTPLLLPSAAPPHAPPHTGHTPPPRDRTCSDRRAEEIPSVIDGGILIPIVDLIRRIHRRLQFKSQISLRILVGARRLDASKVTIR
ncbi:hypothetical protein F511_32858 [Dorcoceras hygrometricum]|uniref:Uncharacterized protein n=1 Tax=Dorcoceras hygrometricum TaxID=472368 RepID=A0A2Z7AHF8_9LAMI|nr:hypothetical protein F511_32858 [Dorcoceras hygrometricum]